MILSLLFYLIAIIIALFLLRKAIPFYIFPFFAVFFSFFGHAISTYLYSLGDSDSTDQFFPLANPHFYRLGTQFVEFLVWWVRYLFTGDSLIATFYFFSAFAFIGSVLWYMLYLRCIQRLKIRGEALYWPALVLLCWPSYLIYTAGIGKDSLSYFLLALIFLCFFNLKEAPKKNNFLNLALILAALSLLTLIRPYLLMLLMGSYCIYLFPGWRKISISYLLLGFLVFFLMLYVSHSILTQVGQGNLNVINLSTVAEKSALQQMRQASGTHFYMPSVAPVFRLLFLPYAAIMNLCFPLFYLARNAEGVLASFENLVLVYILIWTIRSRDVVKNLFQQLRPLKFFFWFFILGVFFMGIGNTNLGAATRGKAMYVPGFLVVYCVAYAYKKRKQKNIKK